MSLKSNSTDEIQVKPGAGRAFNHACTNSSQRVLAQIKETKAIILAESHDLLKVQEHLLKLALNEAEALASQMLYPHLLFPALAVEKSRP